MGKSEIFEAQLKTASGDPVWMLFSHIITEFDGEKVILGAMYDIHERRMTEEALKVSEMKFRELAENIDEVFWMAELPSENVVYVSPAFEKIWAATNIRNRKWKFAYLGYAASG